MELHIFKAGDWRLAVSMVRSTRTRFRQYCRRLESAPGNASKLDQWDRSSRHSGVRRDTAIGHSGEMLAGLVARK